MTESCDEDRAIIYQAVKNGTHHFLVAMVD